MNPRLFKAWKREVRELETKKPELQTPHRDHLERIGLAKLQQTSNLAGLSTDYSQFRKSYHHAVRSTTARVLRQSRPGRSQKRFLERFCFETWPFLFRERQQRDRAALSKTHHCQRDGKRVSRLTTSCPTTIAQFVQHAHLHARAAN